MTTDIKIYPLVSITCLTYNQRNTIIEALKSLFEQNYINLEIIISDDCSDDGTAEEIEKCLLSYNGPHRTEFNINSKNIGINANYNKAFSLAKGELILIASGDDISLPERASETVHYWLAAEKKPSLIASPVIDMYPDGSIGEIIMVSDLSKIDTLKKWLNNRPYVIGAGHAWSRSLIQDFSLLPTQLTHEDQIASYRAALFGSGVTLKSPLVKYRRGGSSKNTEITNHIEWLKKRHIDAIRDAAFWKQLSIDMKNFPDASENLPTVEKHLYRCLYESRIIETSNVFNKLRVFFKHSETDFLFRLRTLLTVILAKNIFEFKLWANRYRRRKFASNN